MQELIQEIDTAIKNLTENRGDDEIKFQSGPITTLIAILSIVKTALNQPLTIGQYKQEIDNKMEEFYHLLTKHCNFYNPFEKEGHPFLTNHCNFPLGDSCAKKIELSIEILKKALMVTEKHLPSTLFLFKNTIRDGLLKDYQLMVYRLAMRKFNFSNIAVKFTGFYNDYKNPSELQRVERHLNRLLEKPAPTFYFRFFSKGQQFYQLFNLEELAFNLRAHHTELKEKSQLSTYPQLEDYCEKLEKYCSEMKLKFVAMQTKNQPWFDITVTRVRLLKKNLIKAKDDYDSFSFFKNDNNQEALYAIQSVLNQLHCIEQFIIILETMPKNNTVVNNNLPLQVFIYDIIAEQTAILSKLTQELYTKTIELKHPLRKDLEIILSEKVEERIKFLFNTDNYQSLSQTFNPNGIQQNTILEEHREEKSLSL